MPYPRHDPASFPKAISLASRTLVRDRARPRHSPVVTAVVTTNDIGTAAEGPWSSEAIDAGACTRAAMRAAGEGYLEGTPSASG
jgi:hypothetical protein